MYANALYVLTYRYTQLSEVQGCVQQWREEVVGVVSQLEGMEARMNERVSVSPSTAEM